MDVENSTFHLRFLQQVRGDGDISADPGQIWAEYGGILQFQKWIDIEKQEVCICVYVCVCVCARVGLFLCGYGFLSLVTNIILIFGTVQIGSQEENWYPLHASAWAFLPWQLKGQDIQAKLLGLRLLVNRFYCICTEKEILTSSSIEATERSERL